ncbi:chemotaxis-specific protein-glutamate methyltransferase CheB [Sphingomonas changnyeongensis]|uniref:protein-glutamate methylesterase n=1 Tax=Sphingomonas changnyeongensis TaxID=2698679 RepID=A0A7Z2SAI1_9SPHN|nr:chemotaxis-specific protein-glutamate methyltransferase CheB [Sphingomonas changnyeongensis]
MLIVDDSAVARAVFARMVGSRPEFEIAATVASAAAALDFLAGARVDIILLDIEMPGQDGLTALPAILAASAGARVLIVSSSAEQGAVATIRALTLGAADTLAKPGASAFGGRFADVLAEKLLRLGRAAHAPCVRPAADAGGDGAGAEAVAARLRPLAEGPIDCLAVGASTGGLHALSELLGALPTGFAAPILITQHLPPAFMSFFAAQIAEMARRPAEVARPGARILSGRCYVAPGIGHLGVETVGGAVRIRITDERVASGCMPSVDPMFMSVAEIYGPRALGVVLSGMGRDGALGAARLADSGASVVAQTRDTSVVWGMPGAVVSAGLASAVLPPRQIAELIARRHRAAA